MLPPAPSTTPARCRHHFAFTIIAVAPPRATRRPRHAFARASFQRCASIFLFTSEALMLILSAFAVFCLFIMPAIFFADSATYYYALRLRRYTIAAAISSSADLPLLFSRRDMQRCGTFSPRCQSSLAKYGFFLMPDKYFRFIYAATCAREARRCAQAAIFAGRQAQLSVAARCAQTPRVGSPIFQRGARYRWLIPRVARGRRREGDGDTRYRRACACAARGKKGRYVTRA